MAATRTRRTPTGYILKVNCYPIKKDPFQVTDYQYTMFMKDLYLVKYYPNTEITKVLFPVEQYQSKEQPVKKVLYLEK